ncbi:hypothetical protein X798_06317 [Onchocerca flexuosa]|uniref:Uncharacterized protein n=1 Tax=Onchocerca flexuosa TaxID=387005 RepID=A0A238BP94_9BILA|nr:hypothetical protein X798_06317 [Onchocerca flexuosa]
MIIKHSQIKACILPVALVSGMSVYVAYGKWKKRQPPKAMPIQSLDRFERMMRESMMKRKSND